MQKKTTVCASSQGSYCWASSKDRVPPKPFFSKLHGCGLGGHVCGCMCVAACDVIASCSRPDGQSIMRRPPHSQAQLSRAPLCSSPSLPPLALGQAPSQSGWSPRRRCPSLHGLGCTQAQQAGWRVQNAGRVSQAQLLAISKTVSTAAGQQAAAADSCGRRRLAPPLGRQALNPASQGRFSPCRSRPCLSAPMKTTCWALFLTGWLRSRSWEEGSSEEVAHRWVG